MEQEDNVGYVEYQSNDSGGEWWLKDEDWENLEKAGWKVQWVTLEEARDKNEKIVLEGDGTPKLIPISEKNKRFNRKDEDGVWRFLGAAATNAYRSGLSLQEVINEWESIVQMDADALGCSCCRPPHCFAEYDNNGKRVWK